VVNRKNPPTLHRLRQRAQSRVTSNAHLPLQVVRALPNPSIVPHSKSTVEQPVRSHAPSPARRPFLLRNPSSIMNQGQTTSPSGAGGLESVLSNPLPNSNLMSDPRADDSPGSLLQPLVKRQSPPQPTRTKIFGTARSARSLLVRPRAYFRGWRKKAGEPRSAVVADRESPRSLPAPFRQIESVQGDQSIAGVEGCGSAFHGHIEWQSEKIPLERFQIAVLPHGWPKSLVEV
jgi:hypothetical protein